MPCRVVLVMCSCEWARPSGLGLVIQVQSSTFGGIFPVASVIWMSSTDIQNNTYCISAQHVLPKSGAQLICYLQHSQPTVNVQYFAEYRVLSSFWDLKSWAMEKSTATMLNWLLETSNEDHMCCAQCTGNSRNTQSGYTVKKLQWKLHYYSTFQTLGLSNSLTRRFSVSVEE